MFQPAKCEMHGVKYAGAKINLIIAINSTQRRHSKHVWKLYGFLLGRAAFYKVCVEVALIREIIKTKQQKNGMKTNMRTTSYMISADGEVHWNVCCAVHDESFNCSSQTPIASNSPKNDIKYGSRLAPLALCTGQLNLIIFFCSRRARTPAEAPINFILLSFLHLARLFVCCVRVYHAR